MDLDYEKQVDVLLSESVDSVIDREGNAFDRLIAPFGNRIVLFGAGNFGRRSLASLRRAGLEPLAFSDNNQRLWNDAVDGLEVLPPSIAAARYADSAAFIVTIWHPAFDFRSVAGPLHELRCREVLPFSPLRWKLASDLLPEYCLDAPHKLILAGERIRVAAELWADEESRLEFLAQLKWRLLGDHLALRPDSEFESYFPDDLIVLHEQETFVDCGAYDGDTIRAFLRRRGESFRAIYSFEPDRLNFAKLRACVESLPPDVAKKIAVSSAAVGSSRCDLPFTIRGDESSAVSKESSDRVCCVPLDEALASAWPTYIKLDVEGFEAQALAGARSCIDRCRPVLAVCAYHRQADLWEIPSLLRSLVPGHFLYLRNHEPECWQLVCYAVPPERVAMGPAKVAL